MRLAIIHLPGCSLRFQSTSFCELIQAQIRVAASFSVWLYFQPFLALSSDPRVVTLFRDWDDAGDVYLDQRFLLHRPPSAEELWIGLVGLISPG